MRTRYETVEQAIASNPEHPVVVHGLFCLARIVSGERASRVRSTILNYFNK